MQEAQAKAAAEVLPVSGAGVLSDGSNFYLVPSQSEEGRSHVVTERDGYWACDCKGFHYRGKCVHVTVVIAHQEQLQRPRETAERDAREAQEIPASRGTDVTPAPAPAPTRQSMLNRTRAFSLMA